MSGDASQLSEIYILVSVDLDIMMRTFEMSSFPLRQSICYFFRRVSEVLMHRISISRIPSCKCALVVHTHLIASSSREERF